MKKAFKPTPIADIVGAADDDLTSLLASPPDDEGPDALADTDDDDDASDDEDADENAAEDAPDAATPPDLGALAARLAACERLTAKLAGERARQTPGRAKAASDAMPLEQRLAASEQRAAAAHPDYHDVTADFPSLVAANPELRDRALGHDHPAEYAYQVCRAARRQNAAVADYRTRMEAALRAQLENDYGDRTQARPPKSFARARSSRGGGDSDFGPTPLDVIFARKH